MSRLMSEAGGPGSMGPLTSRGRTRRLRVLSMSRQVLVTIRYIRAKTGLRFVRVEAAPGLESGFLHRVLRVVKAAKHAIGVHLQLAAQRMEQCVKSRLVTFSGGLKQRPFIFFQHDR